MKLVLPAAIACFCVLGTASAATTLLGFSGSAYLSPHIVSVEAEDGTRITDRDEIEKLVHYSVFDSQEDYFEAWMRPEDRLSPSSYSMSGCDVDLFCEDPYFFLFDGHLYGEVFFDFVGAIFHNFFNSTDNDLLVTVDFVGGYDLDYFSHIPNASISGRAGWQLWGLDDLWGVDGFDFAQDFALDGIGSFSLSGEITKPVTFSLKPGGSLFLDESTGVDALITIDPPTPIPLPASLPMLLVGLAGLGWMAGRRRCHIPS